MRISLIQRVVLVVIIMICLILAGCGKSATSEETAPPVRSQVIQMSGTGANASYSGEVRGRYESQLAFQVAGKIIKRNVDLGSVVHSGDSLMEIDSKDIVQTVNVNSAQVYSAQAQLKLAENNLTRYRQLYEANAISHAEYDQYQSAYDVAVAAVDQATAQYAQGSNQLGYSTLYADNDGVISSINAEAGQIVSAGQAVLTLVQDGEREIEINIPENRLAELRQAGQIQVGFWAVPNLIVAGQVREISPIADKVARTYKVRISLINLPENIQLGMTATVTVTSPDQQTVAFIPLSAVYQTGDTPNVWIINDGQVNLRPIKVGVFGDNQIEVLAGLKNGDVVVTAGVHKLQEGQKVRLVGDSQ